MPAPFAILGIDHVVLRATDPAALERFYVDVLGCTVEKRQEAISLTQLRAGRTLIDIVPAGQAGPAAGEQSGRGANLDHLCLRIEPFDAAAIQAHFAASGYDCGEEKSRFGADGQGPSVYLAMAWNSRGRRSDGMGLPSSYVDVYIRSELYTSRRPCGPTSTSTMNC